MYKSPIEMLMTDIQHQIKKGKEEEIYKAVVSIGINVDKEELIRALQYDREQYKKGYADGHRDAMEELVLCKDCKHSSYDSVHGDYWCYGQKVFANHFCSVGERREGE